MSPRCWGLITLAGIVLRDVARVCCPSRLLAIAALRDHIAQTAQDVLEQGDVKIYRLDRASPAAR